MKWYRRLLWPVPRRGGWPDRPAPTVPGREPVRFHCPACKEPAGPDRTTCAACGGSL